MLPLRSVPADELRCITWCCVCDDELVQIEGESSKTFPAFADFSETVDRLCDLVFSDDPAVGLSESSKALTISSETIDSQARSYLQVLGLL